jgi:hypothetical protein
MRPTPSQQDLFLKLLWRFQEEGVDYVLIGGQAVRLNGYLRATEDVDLLLKPGRVNGEKIIRALSFLSSSKELQPEWFESTTDEVENIRIADDLIVDLLFAANGQTIESVRKHIRQLRVESVTVNVLNIDGLMLTKTDYREKDKLDKLMLEKLKAQ